MSNLAQQFSILGRKQLAISDGVELLRQAQRGFKNLAQSNR